MLVQVSYMQTPFERFETTMNEDVRAILESNNFTVRGESGGSMIGHSYDDLVADNSFLVDADIDDVEEMLPVLQERVGRRVDVREYDDCEYEVGDCCGGACDQG